MRRLATLGILLATSLSAADFAGMWTGRMPTRNGEGLDVAFKFTQDGNVLGGKLYGEYQSTPIIEGRVSGDEIVFVVVNQEQAGNQINETRFRFTGTLKGSAIEMTREREQSVNAGNSGGVQFRGSTKILFCLKRLL